MTKTTIGLAFGSALVLLAPVAAAQEASGQASGTVQATAVATPSTTTAPAVAAVSVGPAHEDDTPDHERFVGRFAVGYFGISQLPIGTGLGGGGGVTRGNVNAPVIGVRYWLQRNLGLDLGLGLGYSTGSTEGVNGGTTVTVDKPSAFGLAVHGGVPLAFAHGRHYSFLVVPEATVGFTSGTIKGNGGTPDNDLSGFRLDLGGRIGAEIHFGFIGIPELSLEGSVGLFVRREAFKSKAGDQSASDGTTTFGTNVQADPWALFVNNISAFYYF